MSGKYEELRAKAAFICDMDGVIYHGNKLLPDVPEFVRWLADNNKNIYFNKQQRTLSA